MNNKVTNLLTIDKESFKDKLIEVFRDIERGSLTLIEGYNNLSTLVSSAEITNNVESNNDSTIDNNNDDLDANCSNDYLNPDYAEFKDITIAFSPIEYKSLPVWEWCSYFRNNY